MQQSATVSLYSWLQPDENAWNKFQELVETWNNGHPTQWFVYPPHTQEVISYQIKFEDINTLEFHELQQQLDQYKNLHGLNVDVVIDEVRAQNDVSQADFINLFGFEPYDFGIEDDLEDYSDQMPLVANLMTNFAPAVECPGCGWVEPFSGEQLAPFVVDESLLYRKYNSENQEWDLVEKSWDLLTLPGGILLISNRLVKEFEEHKVSGYRILDVVSSVTEQPSNRLFQLLPNHIIAELCTEHSEISGGMCTVCGRVLGKVEGRQYLQQQWVNSDEIIGRRPGGLRLLYFNQRVYRLLQAIEAQGMHLGSPIYLCHHTS
jgi:hypothetical protein